jgi:hypothetical protein
MRSYAGTDREIGYTAAIHNLVMSELLRRRCKLIICVDGESDPTFTFQGPRTLIRHAQIVPFL